MEDDAVPQNSTDEKVCVEADDNPLGSCGCWVGHAIGPEADDGLSENEGSKNWVGDGDRSEVAVDDDVDAAAPDADSDAAAADADDDDSTGDFDADEDQDSTASALEESKRERTSLGN